MSTNDRDILVRRANDLAGAMHHEEQFIHVRREQSETLAFVEAYAPESGCSAESIEAVKRRRARIEQELANRVRNYVAHVVEAETVAAGIQKLGTTEVTK